MLNKIAQLMMGVGATGLFLSFSTLIRGREGSLVFLIAGAALLALGAPLYYASLPKRRDPEPVKGIEAPFTAGNGAAPSPAHSAPDAAHAVAASARFVPKKERVWPEQKMPSPRSERYIVALAYILVPASLIVCTATTVWVIVTGADPAILFLLWIGLGGSSVFIAARHINLRKK